MWNVAPFNSSYNNIASGGSLTPDVDSLIRLSVSQNNVFDRVCLDGDFLIGIDVLGKLYKYSLKNLSLEWDFQSLSHNFGSGLYLDGSFVITPAEIIDATSGNIIFNLLEESEYLQDLTSEKISDFGLLFQHERSVLRTSIAKSGAKLMIFGLDDFSLEIKNIPFIPYCYSSEDGSVVGIDGGNRIVKFLCDSGKVFEIGCLDFEPMFLGVGASSNIFVAINPVEANIALHKGGEQIWKKSCVDFLPNSRHFSQAVSIDDELVITTVDDGYSYWVIALDIDTGELVWKSSYETSKGFCVSGENIYTVRADGTPVIFDRKTGEVQWDSTVIVPTNKVIVSSDYIVFLDMTFNATIFKLK